MEETSFYVSGYDVSYKMSETVKVIIRVRPFSTKEKNEGHFDIIQSNEQEATITITDPKQNQTRNFVYDSVFSSQSTQLQVYSSARPVVMSVLDGYNGTVFAYGQTGTGKSFTMEGDRKNPDLRGIIPNAFDHIYSEIQKKVGITCLMRVSYMEIYNEDIRDLLTDTGKLEIKEHPTSGIYVKDLTSVVVKSPEDMFKVIEQGSKNRSTGATLMNEHSSRSHSIFQIFIEMEDNGKFRSGKLSLVDLAGSERQEKTKATGDRFKEATKINLSLTTLGIVIKHLVDGKSTHVPYRDSKLTRLLQDSLGGNSKTLMIATLSPASYNYEETMSTLRYASRAKMIKNKPKINQDPKDALLRQFEDELQLLRSLLSEMDSKPTSGKKKDSSDEVNRKLEEHAKKKKELLQQMEELQNQLIKSENVEISSAEIERLELSKKSELIEEERRKERELKRQLIENSDKKISLQTSFSSLEEEAQILAKKIKQAQQQLKKVKTLHFDTHADFERELAELNAELDNVSKTSEYYNKISSDLFLESDIDILAQSSFEFKPKYSLNFESSGSIEYPSYQELLGISPKNHKIQSEIQVPHGLIRFRKLVN
eukprot:NODE_4_length_55019_cov_0.425091.p6 type:complete len:596 gc:universal NODE_4_length_55019_cov_0.425091:52074-53861(+)